MDYIVFTGGYSEPTPMASGEIVPGRCPGVSVYKLDGEGKLELRSVAASLPNPSCVLASRDGKAVYCVSEVHEWQGVPGSMVSAYRFDRETATLTYLNSQPTTGNDACHLAEAQDGSHLICANYSGGSIAVFPIREDRGLDAPSFVIRHHGSSVDPDRQTSPHPHQIMPAQDGRVYVPDLGMDRAVCYRADWEKGWLLPDPAGDVPALPGQGSRHCVFSADGEFLYLMCELTAEVNVYAREGEGWKLLQTADAKMEGQPWLGAAIRLHPNGKLLFCSVRRSDHIAVFRVGEDGCLTLLRLVPSGGEIPRDFDLTPDGRFLLAAHQDTHSVCVFSVCEETGELKKVWLQEDVGSVTSLSIR